MSDEPRQCYICLDEAGEEREWVAPCRCSGTLKWVHQTCMIRWVREHENTQPFTVPSCPQCRTKLRLVPEKGTLVSALEFVDTTIYPACKFLVGWCLGLIAFDAACTTFGIFAESQVYGLDETIATVTSSSKLETVMRLHLTSIFLVFVNSLQWERRVLRSLRKLSRLPSGKWIFPEEVPSRFCYTPRDKSVSQVVVGSALLPVFGGVIGNLCFSSVDSKFARVLFGGLTYLGVKGCLSMFLLQRQEVRRKKMVITPYRAGEPQSSANTGTVGTN